MLYQIKLEMARTPDHPVGDSGHGYEFVAPLDGDGHLDVDGWHDHRAKCIVRRFAPKEPDEHGHLIHTQGRQWAFHYDLDVDPETDESGFKFSSHIFTEGEYVSITEHDGETRPFRVTSSRPAKI
jgi:hypothetical protein